MADLIVLVMMRGLIVGMFAGGHFAQQLREFVFVLAHEKNPHPALSRSTGRGKMGH